MTLEELKGLIGDQPEAIKFLDELSSNTDSLTKRINTLETDSRKAFESRDATKGKAKLLLDKLGLDDLDNIDDELLDKVINKGKGSDAEVQNLKLQLARAVADKSEIETSYKGKLSNYALKSELTKTGLAQKALNSEVYQILEGLALSGASYTDDGKVIYRNEDGSTKYTAGGKEMTLDDRVNELSNSQSYASLFKPIGTGGTGARPPQHGSTSPDKIAGLSAVEKMNIGRKK